MAMEPTVGRVVHVYPNDSRSLAGQSPEGGPHHALRSPLVGHIAHVHEDGKINVGGFDMNGHPYRGTSLRLLAPGEEKPQPGTAYAEWMPYQKKKAAEGDHNSESAEPRPDGT